MTQAQQWLVVVKLLLIGTGTFTVPGGKPNISIMAVGGGAGPGTNSALGAGQLSGGGGSGAVAWLNNISLTAGQVINYTVGAGGAGNNDGGDTTVQCRV